MTLSATIVVPSPFRLLLFSHLIDHAPGHIKATSCLIGVVPSGSGSENARADTHAVIAPQRGLIRQEAGPLTGPEPVVWITVRQGHLRLLLDGILLRTSGRDSPLRRDV